MEPWGVCSVQQVTLLSRVSSTIAWYGILGLTLSAAKTSMISVATILQKEADGALNEGSITSLNYYATGAVSSLLHHSVCGISPLDSQTTGEIELQQRNQAYQEHGEYSLQAPRKQPLTTPDQLEIQHALHFAKATYMDSHWSRRVRMGGGRW